MAAHCSAVMQKPGRHLPRFIRHLKSMLQAAHLPKALALVNLRVKENHSYLDTIRCKYRIDAIRCKMYAIVL